jgi:chromosome partitioning protein
VIIAVVSQKGGTGKTTIATNLAACYAAQGREVMLVDADPQHSALD